MELLAWIFDTFEDLKLQCIQVIMGYDDAGVTSSKIVPNTRSPPSWIFLKITLKSAIIFGFRFTSVYIQIC